MDLLKNVLGIGSNVANFVGGLVKKGKKKLDDFEDDPFGTAFKTIKNNTSIDPIQPVGGQPGTLSIGPLTIGKPQQVKELKFDLPKQQSNPVTDFLKDVALGIVNSVPKYTQGTQELNQQVKDAVTGKGLNVKNLIASTAKTAELPLNLVGGGGSGTVAKNIAEQGFRKLGTQGLIQASKEGAKLGAKYGAGFGAIQGAEEGKDITDPGEYLTNLAKDILVSGAGGTILGGGLSAGGYGANKIIKEYAKMIETKTPERFATDIASRASKYLDDEVIKPFRKAFKIDGATETEIRNAVANFQAGKIDDALSGDTLIRSTKEFLPQFAASDTITQSKIWDYILARKHGSTADVPPELVDLDKQIFKVVGFDLRQAGFIRTKEFTDLFQKATGKAQTPEESISGLTKTADEIIQSIAPGTKLPPVKVKDMKALRAAINKEAYGIAGVNPAMGKSEKAAYEAAKQDPDVGRFINTAEEYIAKIDQMIETGSGAQPAMNAPVLDLIKKAKEPKIVKESVAKVLPKVEELIIKQRGLVGSIQEAEKVTKKTKAKVAGEYITKPNKDLMGEAKALLQDGASIDFKSTKNLDQKVAATIQEAITLDKSGQHEAAAALFNNLSEHATELGRGVQAFSLLDKMSPEAISLSVAGKIKKYNQTAVRKIPELTGDQVKIIGDKITEMDGLTGREKNIALNELQNTLNDFIPSSLADKAVTVWKAGLLTSLRTHERNLLGNTIMGVAEIAKSPFASVADMIMASKTGKRSMTATLQGSMAGAKKGAQAMKDIIQKGYDPEDAISKFDIKRITWGKNPVEQFLKKATDAVFRPLAGEDKIFWHSTYARSLYDQAGAAAINAGKQGNQKLIENLVKNPTEDMLKNAFIDANTATFHDRNVMSGVASAIKRAAQQNYGEKIDNKVAGAVGSEVGKVVTEVLAPFTGVPSSIIGKTLSYSPIGLVKGAIDMGQVMLKDMPELQRQAAQEVGRGVMGTGLFGLGAYLMSQGLMTGQPKDAAEADLWAAQGKQKNSILIGGKWRSINSIGPQNLVLLAGAKLQEEMTKLEGGDMGAYAGGLLKDQLSQTFLAGVQGPLNAITDPARYGKSYIGNTVASIIPNIVKDVSKAFDPNARELNTAGDYFKSGIPGLRNTLVEKRDVLGNIIPQEPTGVGAFFDLFNSKTPIDNAVLSELDRLQQTGNDATPSKLTPTQTIQKQKVKLTFEQLNNLEAGVGQALKPQLEALIQSDTYKSLSDEEKANTIDNLVTKVRTQYKNVNGQDLLSTSDVKGAKTKEGAVGKDLTYSYVDSSGSYKTIDIGKVASMPEKTRYEKTLKENAAFKIVDDILDNLPKDQQAQALKAVGLDVATATYYNVARQPDDAKTSYVLDQVDKLGGDRREMINMLIQGRSTINNKMIVSNGVLDDLYDSGYISSAERTQLKKIKLDAQGKQTAGSRASGSSASPTAIKALIKSIGESVSKGPETKSVSELIATLRKTQAPQLKVPTDTVIPDLGGSKALIKGLTATVPNTKDLITKAKAGGRGIATARALIERSKAGAPTASNSRLTLRVGGSR